MAAERKSLQTTDPSGSQHNASNTHAGFIINISLQDHSPTTSPSRRDDDIATNIAAAPVSEQVTPPRMTTQLNIPHLSPKSPPATNRLSHSSPQPAPQSTAHPATTHIPLPAHSEEGAFTTLPHTIYTNLLTHLAHLQTLSQTLTQAPLTWRSTWTRASVGAALADHKNEKVLWSEIQILFSRMHRGTGQRPRAYSVRVVSWEWGAGSNGLTGGSSRSRAGFRVLAGPVGWTEFEGGPVGFAGWEEERDPGLGDVVGLLMGVCRGEARGGQVFWNARVVRERRVVVERKKISLSWEELEELKRAAIEGRGETSGEVGLGLGLGFGFGVAMGGESMEWPPAGFYYDQ